MAHELNRLRSSLLDTPLLIDPKSFESVVNYLDKRCEGLKLDVEEQEDDASYKTLHYEESALGVIHISGPLTNKPTGWEALCGGTSYESIKEDFEALVQDGVKTIAFIVASGGGEAFNCFDSGNYLRQLADENGVRIISYVEGLSASAAYALTAISDEIVSNKGSEVGSIGVLIKLLNDSKHLEKEGFERTYVSAGKSKTPFEEDGSFRKEFIEDLQYKVDILYKEFTEYVAEHRGISVEAVRNTEAKTFLAEDALELGLIDAIMTQEEFYSYLNSEATNQNGKEMKDRIFKFKSKGEPLEMSKEQLTQVAELSAQLESVQSEFSLVQEALASAELAKAELLAAVTAKETELAAALAQVAQLQELQVEAKTQARKDKLSAVMAADHVEAVAASLAGLDDAAFGVVLEGFAIKQKQLSGSDMFVELGDQGAPDEPTQAPQADATTQILKSRLNIQ